MFTLTVTSVLVAAQCKVLQELRLATAREHNIKCQYRVTYSQQDGKGSQVQVD